MTYAVLQFTFDQAETNVHSLLATAIGVMEEQRNKSARDSSDNQQLCFIISDGLLASRGAQLARLISEAAEKNILIVFLLIDNQGGVGAGSVLDIQSITRTSSGRMMHKLYMGETRIRTRTQRSAFLTRFFAVPDSFPFPFYVVLKDIVSLPKILADALRQWFEALNQN